MFFSANTRISCGIWKFSGRPWLLSCSGVDGSLPLEIVRSRGVLHCPARPNGSAGPRAILPPSIRYRCRNENCRNPRVRDPAEIEPAQLELRFSEMTTVVAVVTDVLRRGQTGHARDVSRGRQNGETEALRIRSSGQHLARDL